MNGIHLDQSSYFSEKKMATHSSILAWKIPGTEEPGGLLSIGSHRVGHDWTDLACMHAFIGEGNGNLLQYSCLENPRDRDAWWAPICGVAQSRKWLKWLGSSYFLLWPEFHKIYITACVDKFCMSSFKRHSVMDFCPQNYSLTFCV